MLVAAGSNVVQASKPGASFWGEVPHFRASNRMATVKVRVMWYSQIIPAGILELGQEVITVATL